MITFKMKLEINSDGLIPKYTYQKVTK